MGERERRSDQQQDETRRPRRQVAVALEHDFGSSQAPRVVASGRGALAEQILHLAFVHGVKVREDADLAEMLAAIDIDSEIPPEAFLAVSEILIYIYKANGMLPGAAGSLREPAR